MQSWIGERMVEEHRRDLAASTRTGIGGEAERDDPALMAEAVTALGDQVVRARSLEEGCQHDCRSLLRWGRC